MRITGIVVMCKYIDGQIRQVNLSKEITEALRHDIDINAPGVQIFDEDFSSHIDIVDA